MRYKVIRNYNDANKLIDMGYEVKKIDRDRRDREFLIFLFEESDELLSDLKAITPVK